ncbi:MAG: neutral/alkaline non-lysosomal ceramidase N-terminal domain-containing protein [Flavobacteriales bacterium]|jgi:neutral ceramidase|nr:neutral/alkaline non-lysosomal ceramidase N-terminal domain-containing protein [Flavobacteriales bacterium]
MYRIGFSKVAVLYPRLEVGMMGYGMWENRVKGEETKLYARAMAIESEEESLVFVNVEMAFITPGIRREVMKCLDKAQTKLRLKESSLMLTAQHTHSGPGGFSEYAYYSFTTPGFSKEIRDAFVEAIVKAVVEAYNKKELATLSYKEASFGSDVAVAWNRSLKAYNCNSENVEEEVDHSQALDRKMYLMQVNSMQGKILGSVNWFGVHATAIGNDNVKVSSDNKGYAADLLEQKYPGTVHIFAQGKAGDVSPHFHGVGAAKKREEVKKTGDHLYARQNGEKQFIQAHKIIDKDAGFRIEGRLDSELSYADYTKIKVDSEFTNGVDGKRTSEACFGMPFFKGTPIDGKGAPFIAMIVLKGLNKLWNKKRESLKESQGSKDIVINASTKELLGQGKMDILPSFIDGAIKEMNRQSRNKALIEHTLVPVVLPVQIWMIGTVVILGVPGEITTVAGRRLEKQMERMLEEVGVQKVILSSYANSYMGYITTQEEYEVQLYEGGHTVFGQWTLAAFQTKFKHLCAELIKPKEEHKINREIKPPIFSEEELSRRAYSRTSHL